MANKNKVRSKIHQKFLGEGSYGCTWKPGIKCDGSSNKKRKQVNKIQEIDFHSKNELFISELIKKIPNYNLKFAPVDSHCIVKFNKILDSNIDINKCETLFQDYIENKDYIFGDNNFLDNDYYMFYINYIKGDTISDFFKSHKELPYIFYKIYLQSFYILLDNIHSLNKKHIIHNDLHSGNIMYNFKTEMPVIIDFGLSYYTKNLYIFESNDVVKINYYNLKKFFFDFRSDGYNYNVEKRFISFCAFNSNDYYFKELAKNSTYGIMDNKDDINDINDINDLTNEIINIFIDDAYKTIVNNFEIKFIFNNDELKVYKKMLQEYYVKFLDKKKYKNISDIVIDLLPHVFEFNDVYSLCISFIHIYYRRFQSNQELADKSQFIFIFAFLAQLFKKVLAPDPKYRINSLQFHSILKHVVSYIFDFDSSLLEKTSHNDVFNNVINEFKIKFNNFLKTINIEPEIFFGKIYNYDYAFIDFDYLFIKKHIYLFKKIDIKL